MTQRNPSASFSPATWRLLIADPVTGARGMATDEAVLREMASGTPSATVGVYAWAPGFLSIGSDQSMEIVDADGCRRNGWMVIRRPTPGRAILHLDTVGVSICLSRTDSRASGESSELFSRFAKPFVSAVKAMGVDPDRSRPYYQDRGPQGMACYDGPSEYEVTVGGRKLVCGSLTGDDKALLIQCTVPLLGESSRIAEALHFDLPGQRMALMARIGYRATTLEALLGRPIGLDEFTDHLRQGFSKTLNISLEEASLTERETAMIAQLQAEKQDQL